MSGLEDNYIIRSKRQMRALAAPTRQEIVDVLPGMGTVSVAELATALGRPADSLYYHLRILNRVGLVRSAGSHRLNGRRETLFRAIAPEMSLCYELGRKGNGSQVMRSLPLCCDWVFAISATALRLRTHPYEVRTENCGRCAKPAGFRRPRLQKSIAISKSSCM
jgi:DNA-binding transcriptional ArsR family regulator